MPRTCNRVYIVDDSPIVRQRLVRMICDIPNTEIVGEADSAHVSVAAILEATPDWVILDISMPGGSGMHLLEHLKMESTPPRVIMLTNFTHEPYREKCRELGADHFFDKSTEFEQIMRVIEEYQPPPAPS